MSPRRSSRARQTQPLRNNPSQSGSSSSTSSNKNHTRTTSRANSRPEGQMKSVTPGSSSDEPPTDRTQPTDLDTRQTRQKKREQDTLDGIIEGPMEEYAEDEGDDGEVTRCICGQQEYPGPPEHVAGRPCLNHRTPDNPSKSHPDVPPHPLLFESGSLFIQCETCHVWQHGGCVGIMDEAMSPEHYYCEECKDSLHKIYVEPSGRKYSKYTRAYQDWECTRPSVTSKKSIYYETQSVYHLLGSADRTNPAAINNAKRRSTMNSRAAAEEDEAFLKAIEESKSDGKSLTASAVLRRAKRGREESPEESSAIQEIKRRRTGSESGSPSLRPAESVPAGSDTETAPLRNRAVSAARKGGRGATGQQISRDSTIRDREKGRERERVDVATKRKGRTEKLKGYEAMDDPSRPLDVASNLATVGKTAVTLNSTKNSLVPPSTSAVQTNRRGVKSGGRRGRAGRNQYTKDRDAPADSKHESPRGSHSRDSEDVGNSDGPAGNTLVNGSKPSKPRQMNPNRTSMNDLRKRVAGILEYITRTQVEMAGDKTPPEQNGQTSKNKSSAAVSSSNRNKEAKSSRTKTTTHETGVIEAQEVETADGKGHAVRDLSGDREAAAAVAAAAAAVDEAAFKGLSSLEMMDVLTRELVLWQRMHGKFGER